MIFLAALKPSSTGIVTSRMISSGFTHPVCELDGLHCCCSRLGTSYFFIRITPSPILLRRRSGYFSRAFSACSLVLNGLDNCVNSRPTYSKSNHRSIILDISDL